MTDRTPPTDGPTLAPPIAEHTPESHESPGFPPPLPLDPMPELAPTGALEVALLLVIAVILMVIGWIGVRK